MKTDSYEFLQFLMETPSPSGFEEEISAIWRKKAKRFADKVYTDSHGNSIAVVNPEGSPRIMLAGHIDEIGLMITYINPQGFLYFRGIGGWDRQILPGQRVEIRTGTGPVIGVIGKKPIHLLSLEESKRVAEFRSLWIDCGFKDYKEAVSVVSIGDSAVISSPGMRSLRNGLLTGRGFDDKIGAFIILEALSLISKMKPKAAVYAVATVQEEIGCRGAKTSAYGINPDFGIAVDVGFATDVPDSSEDVKALGSMKMGGGPIVARGPNINPSLFEKIRRTAAELDIKIQIEAAPGVTGTDAREMQVSRAGVPTALISIPNRYMHSPVEMVHEGDVEAAIKLIAGVWLREDNSIKEITDTCL